MPNLQTVNDMQSISVDDAVRFIIDYVRNPRSSSYSNYGYDLYLPNVIRAYRMEFEAAGSNTNPLDSRAIALSGLFLDAAWELCRRGILRQGVKSFGAQSTSDEVGFSITQAGKRWVQDADESHFIILAPNRMSILFEEQGRVFGKGFAQRAEEAIRCYSAGAYLASCVMCGAAAESILLKVAIEKSENEEEILSQYKRANGRRNVTNIVTGQLAAALSSQFQNYMGLLSYWRDDAAHGVVTSISEAEAHEAITRLLRLGIFVNDNWGALTE